MDASLLIPFTFAQLLWTNFPRFRDAFSLLWSNRQASITVTSGWPQYTQILRWVAERNDDIQLLLDEYSEEIYRLQERHSTNEKCVQNTDGYWVSGNQDTVRGFVGLRYNHTVHFQWQGKNICARRITISSPTQEKPATEKLEIWCNSWGRGNIEALSAFMAFVTRSYGLDICVPHIQFGIISWVPLRKASTRSLDTVYLDKTIKDSILNRINEFFNPKTEETYRRLHIPYKLGILFTGPPGCGKTTMAKAIATTFELTIHILKLSSLELNDDLLVKLAQKTDWRSMILIEDADCVDASQSRHIQRPWPIQQKGLTLAGLLDVLGGVADLNKGQLVVLSTNRPEVLDEALIRSGRIDVKVHFPKPTKEDIVGMFIRWYKNRVESTSQLMAMADEFSSLLPLSIITVSEIEGLMLAHLMSPQGAIEAARGMFHSQQVIPDRDSHPAPSVGSRIIGKEGSS